jgi:hypothetical protein
MTDLALGLALALVIEGVAYALFPAGMKRMMHAALSLPEASLRQAGLVAALLGFGIAWLLRG